MCGRNAVEGDLDAPVKKGGGVLEYTEELKLNHIPECLVNSGDRDSCVKYQYGVLYCSGTFILQGTGACLGIVLVKQTLIFLIIIQLMALFHSHSFAMEDRFIHLEHYSQEEIKRRTNGKGGIDFW